MKEGSIYEWDFTDRTVNGALRKKLMQLVCAEFSVTPEQLKGRDKRRNYVDARRVFAYLSKRYMTDTFQKIGMELGGRDHSTIMVLLRGLEDFIDIKDPITLKIEKIRNQFLNPNNL